MRSVVLLTAALALVVASAAAVEIVIDEPPVLERKAFGAKEVRGAVEGALRKHTLLGQHHHGQQQRKHHHQHQHHHIAGTEPSASATVLLHESLFHKLVSAILPAIIDGVRALQIPGESQKHFSFDTIKIQSFNIGGVTIGFAAPNKVVITLTDLELAIPSTPFAVFDKVLFVHLKCSGDFSVSVAKTNIEVSFEVEDRDGKLAMADGSASVHFGELNVEHHFHDFLCKVGQDIVQLFIGNIDRKIRDLVEKDIGPVATKALNSAFAHLAQSASIPLVAAPKATSDSIQVDINLLPPKAAMHAIAALKSFGGRHVTVQHARNSNLVGGPVATPFPSRDVEAFISQASANGLFEHFQQIGHLNFDSKTKVNTSIFKAVFPAAYNRCPDCRILLSNQFPTAPTASFANGNAQAETRGMHFGVHAITIESNMTTTELFTLGINGTFVLGNVTVSGSEMNTIAFNVLLPTFAFYEIRSEVGPVDTTLLTQVIDFLMQDVALPIFNENFKGVTIPMVDGIQVDEVEFDFNGGQAAAGIDVSVQHL